jgi:hypothetical protein
MKKYNLPIEDDLRPEYNLKELQVRKVGSKRKISQAKTVQLDPDVAEIFPDDNSVNEALRFLIRMTRQNQ